MPCPPFGSPGLQNCIEKQAKLRHGPPLCKLGIRFDHTKGMFCAFLLGFGRKIGPNLSEDLFFCASPKFGRKLGPNLNEDLFFCFSPNFGRKNGVILGGTIFDSDLCSSQIFRSFCPPLFKILRTLLATSRPTVVRSLLHAIKLTKIINEASILHLFN